MLDPEELPHDFVIDFCRPYLGEMAGVYSSWTPLQDRGWLFPEEVDATGRTIVMTCEQDQAEFGKQQIQSYGADPRMPHSKGSMRARVEPAR